MHLHLGYSPVLSCSAVRGNTQCQGTILSPRESAIDSTENTLRVYPSVPWLWRWRLLPLWEQQGRGDKCWQSPLTGDWEKSEEVSFHTCHGFAVTASVSPPGCSEWQGSGLGGPVVSSTEQFALQWDKAGNWAEEWETLLWLEVYT